MVGGKVSPSADGWADCVGDVVIPRSSIVGEELGTALSLGCSESVGESVSPNADG